MWNEQLFLAETITDYIRTQDFLNERDMRTLAHLRNDAVCVDSPIGEYRCYVEIHHSPQSGIDSLCVDTCLQHEICELWKRGVTTIGCCCGHGRKQAYVQVTPQSVQKMHELGYEPLQETEDGQGKWCFKPKTYLPFPPKYTKLVSNPYTFPANDLVNRQLPPKEDEA